MLDEELEIVDPLPEVSASADDEDESVLSNTVPVCAYASGTVSID